MKSLLLLSLFGLSLALVSHEAYVHVGLAFSLLVAIGCLLGLRILVAEAKEKK